jgi:hypothetical protein
MYDLRPALRKALGPSVKSVCSNCSIVVGSCVSSVIKFVVNLLKMLFWHIIGVLSIIYDWG